MRRHWIAAMLFSAIVFPAMMPRPAEAASFQGLGDVPGSIFWSETNELSADGSTVVGVGYFSDGFRWTATEGVVRLGETRDIVIPSGVSGTGEIVVGTRSIETPDGGRRSESFRWDEANGFVALIAPDSTAGSTSANAISSDGRAVVGSWRNIHLEDTAFRWDAVDGWLDLGDLAGGTLRGVAMDVSGDGSVVVGRGRSSLGTEAFRWDASQGMIGLGDLPGGGFSSSAGGTSVDGTFIVGSSLSGFWSDAFRWHETNGMVSLAPLGDPAYFGSVASDVSADGSIVVGHWTRRSETSEFAEAMIWDATNGMRSLQVLLGTLGLDLGSWHLSYATALSADGLTIAGTGVNPDGQTEAWIAVIPEPGTALLISVGLAVLSSRGRSRGQRRP